MPPVFAHGRLRLYLLKLLDEAPRHGYEVIRLLEERFHGLYAPSAGTVYPRLAKLEAEGLVTHATEGGRKVYSLTDAGRAELSDRGGELADLELEIRESVAELAAEIREDVRGSASDLRRQMREAASQARATGTAPPSADGGPGHHGDQRVGREVPHGPGGRGRTAGAAGEPGRAAGGGKGGGAPWESGPWADPEAWRQAREELRRAKEEWKEQARRAKEESRRAKQDAQRARREAKDARDFAREEVERIAHRVQEQTQAHLRAGDWQGALREGLSEVTRAMTRMSQAGTGPTTPDPSRADTGAEPTAERAPDPYATADESPDATASAGATAGAADATVGPLPDWATADDAGSTNPARDLERLLDRFRDGVRDAARDHGVTADQLAAVRAQLAHAAAHVDGVLRARPTE
ncbi:helix-turn-helix transcriptional regulator [Streptomyces sp. 71268]|uniref:PadR family transcriptional regulator n=1 Tax=Streptomyces sp. 71268 TaxID=3002640 RepID=UPI0023F6AEDC|nr:PadR family transcriptional regulator [Streptomyces sp. 71268]WEV25426.1 helix-turn-helix transcriptional regulator [Streptomyces sp. 71268]